ncbi:hypothetical protein WR25_07394 [Diploscapter pachys]|uniref:Anaphase-promoting complex subunit 11 n=1 Tax=Diploscapter pachys TaxID=2018661 RepID=A0A2A2L3Z8_9BILA|nr:hypothetical protein WR25_07394 [Diploscapter pachys]
MFADDVEMAEEFDRSAQSPSGGSWDGLSLDTPTSQLFKESPNEESGKARSKTCPNKNISNPLVLPTKTRLKITVNKLHLTGSWHWKDCEDETCGICRSPFEATCVDCKFPGDGCPTARGKCSHRFHMHCITKWVETAAHQRACCPLCRQVW